MLSQIAARHRSSSSGVGATAGGWRRCSGCSTRCVQRGLGDAVRLQQVVSNLLANADVARHVREALGRGVRLVALTGYGRPEDRAAAAAAGLDAHAVKPVEADRLLRLVDEEPSAPPATVTASA